MTDLFKAAKNNQWYGPPALTVDAIGGTIKNARIVKLISDDNGEPISVLTVPYNPTSGGVGTPIVGPAGVQVATNVIPQGLGGAANITLGTPGLDVNAVLNYFNYSNAPPALYDIAEEPGLISCVTSTGASSTQIVAAGGAGKKYRLFDLAFEVSATGAVAEVTVNEVTSGTIIAQMSLGAAGSVANEYHFGPNGILQPTANNAIQVTTLATATASVTLMYGAAR